MANLDHYSESRHQTSCGLEKTRDDSNTKEKSKGGFRLRAQIDPIFSGYTGQKKPCLVMTYVTLNSRRPNQEIYAAN